MVHIPEVSIEEVKKPQSIEELYFQYRLSDEYTRLAEKSKKEYNYYANALLTSTYSKRVPEYITIRVAKAIYNNLKKDHSVAFANMFARVWSTIYSWGQEREWVELNPWKAFKKESTRPRKIVWTQEQVYAIVREALDTEGLVPLAKAIMLLYETGQRPADVLRMTINELNKDDNGWFLKLHQKKTDNWVQPAITEETHDLVMWSLSGLNYLIDVEWDQQDLQYAFRKMRKKLGLSDKLQLRDLRRTALTEAGAGGATDDQMKAHSGHASRDMLDVYSVSGRRKALEAHRARFNKDEPK